MEKWKKRTFAALYCAIFRTPSFRKSLKFFGTCIASLGPETVQIPAFSMWSAREAKPRFGAALVRSTHDCETIFLGRKATVQSISKLNVTSCVLYLFKKNT